MAEAARLVPVYCRWNQSLTGPVALQPSFVSCLQSTAVAQPVEPLETHAAVSPGCAWHLDHSGAGIFVTKPRVGKLGTTTLGSQGYYFAMIAAVSAAMQLHPGIAPMQPVLAEKQGDSMAAEPAHCYFGMTGEQQSNSWQPAYSEAIAGFDPVSWSVEPPGMVEAMEPPPA